MVKCAFIGDSISCGAGASRGYTTVATELLRSVHPEIVEVNLAIGGTCLVDSGYPEILPQAIAERPDILVIQHGVNDNAVGFSASEFLWAYRETVRTVRQQLPETVIVCMTICPSRGHYNYTDEWQRFANVGIQEIAAKEHCIVAPVHRMLGGRRELFPDGIHPNDEGHSIMADTLASAIREKRVQHPDHFDFLIDGTGTYRICKYVISIKGESSTSDWTELYNVSRTGFSYRSEHDVEVATPFDSFSPDMRVFLSDRKEDLSAQCDARCRGLFVLPSTGGQLIEVGLHR